MNYLWAFMILTGVVFAAFHGTLPAVTQAALDSAKEAVTLCITMMGVMSFWVGLMKIAEKQVSLQDCQGVLRRCCIFCSRIFQKIIRQINILPPI